MRKPKPLPSVEELNKWFRYDPETGDLWKKPKINAKGELRVLTSLKPIRRKTFSKTTEYYQVYIPCSDRFYLVHRIIWKMWYGEDPDVIDHINGIGTDNRIENLRNVNMLENARNMALHRRNKNGVSGVSLERGVYRVRIGKKELGRFSNFEEAVKIRKQAEIELGYHKNHGTIR